MNKKKIEGAPTIVMIEHGRMIVDGVDRGPWHLISSAIDGLGAKEATSPKERGASAEPLSQPFSESVREQRDRARRERDAASLEANEARKAMHLRADERDALAEKVGDLADDLRLARAEVDALKKASAERAEGAVADRDAMLAMYQDWEVSAGEYLTLREKGVSKNALHCISEALVWRGSRIVEMESRIESIYALLGIKETEMERRSPCRFPRMLDEIARSISTSLGESLGASIAESVNTVPLSEHLDKTDLLHDALTEAESQRDKLRATLKEANRTAMEGGCPLHLDPTIDLSGVATLPDDVAPTPIAANAGDLEERLAKAEQQRDELLGIVERIDGVVSGVRDGRIRSLVRGVVQEVLAQERAVPTGGVLDIEAVQAMEFAKKAKLYGFYTPELLEAFFKSNDCIED